MKKTWNIIKNVMVWLVVATAVFMMILTILAVFIICILFDMLRKNTIEKCILNQINKKL